MKKKTFEEVRKLFESRGFQLLSKDYKGAHSTLEYICSNGHNSKINFNSFQNANGCAECSGNKKKTIEEVRDCFKSRCYQLLSTEYKSNKSTLLYICDKGHKGKIIFSSFQKGVGCLECSGVKKKTIKEVEREFDKRGYQLLTTEYKGNKSPLVYICDQGHKGKISFISFQKGYGCAECSGKKKKTIEEVKKEFDKRGYTLLSNIYKDTHSHLEYICDRGHEGKTCFSKLQRGIGCPSCAERGFNPNKPAILYYLRFQFEGNFYYKIGITNKNAMVRFTSEKTPYTVIKEVSYSVGKDAHDKEREILKKFNKYKYKGHPFLTVGGNTELFIKDVLQLDNSVLYS